MKSYRSYVLYVLARDARKAEVIFMSTYVPLIRGSTYRDSTMTVRFQVGYRCKVLSKKTILGSWGKDVENLSYKAQKNTLMKESFVSQGILRNFCISWEQTFAGEWKRNIS